MTLDDKAKELAKSIEFLIGAKLQDFESEKIDGIYVSYTYSSQAVYELEEAIKSLWG